MFTFRSRNWNSKIVISSCYVSQLTLLPSILALWQLQNVQKRQSQIVKLWQNKLAHIDKLMASYDVHQSGNFGYTKIIKYELNKWRINYE